MSRYETIAVYIMANRRDGALYTGVSSRLPQRIYEHKQSLADGFTKKYNIKSLVYYEVCDTMEQAISREKRLKKYKREQKVALIEKMNPDWKDLYEEIT